MENDELNVNSGLIIGDAVRFNLPLQMEWNPKDDITTYELALCLPILMMRHPIMEWMIGDLNQPHLRHFNITNPNIDKNYNSKTNK